MYMVHASLSELLQYIVPPKKSLRLLTPAGRSVRHSTLYWRDQVQQRPHGMFNAIQFAAGRSKGNKLRLQSQLSSKSGFRKDRHMAKEYA
jgi:hypothetical protein